MLSGLIVLAVGLFIGFIIGFIVGAMEECPREIEHYSCKGKDCDHSKEAIRKARQAMKRN